MSPYDRLAELAERHAELVSAAAWEEAGAAAAEQERLRAALPARPPAWARDALERALLANCRAEAALVGGLDAVGGELGGLRRSRRAVAAYRRA